MWTNDDSIMAEALIPILAGTPDWDKRHDIAWYVSRCQMSGFCDTLEMMRLCAKRWLAGKRKVSPPGTKRRKSKARERRKIMNNLPPELIVAIATACKTEAAAQYRGGNEKALNSLVGVVLRSVRTDASLVRELLIQEIKTTNPGVLDE